MPKRVKRSADSPRPAAPARRDPLSRAARVTELAAIALVAASLFIKFPNTALPPNTPAIAWKDLPSTWDRILFFTAHSRLTWVVLSILSTIVAVTWYRTRHRPATSRIVTLAPFVALLIIALHAAAQAILQSRGTTSIFLHRPDGISHVLFPEGTGPQWKNLFAGDILFCAPIVMARFFSRILRPAQSAQT